MRVLILHNRYRQRGGEDVVVQAQARVLREKGHPVEVFEKDNREIDGYGLLQKAALFAQMPQQRESIRAVEKIVADFKPNVALVHNTLPLLSPGVYTPLKNAQVPIIQYLHNYRLVCAAGTLFRAGAPCNLCLEKDLRSAVRYNCWSNSKLATFAFVRMIQRHRKLGTWQNDVDLFVTLNQFQHEVLTHSGVIPAAKTVVAPNFAYVDAAAETDAGDGFVFVGRLTEEKGLRLLRQAHAQLENMPLAIIGTGPEAMPSAPFCEYLGELPRAEMLARIQRARALVFPSIWDEPFGLSILEAMALGKAVIAARVAGPAEIVIPEVTGLLFERGDAASLSACMRRLQADPEQALRMGLAGRERFLKEYSPEAGYQRLVKLCARVGATD